MSASAARSFLGRNNRAVNQGYKICRFQQTGLGAETETTEDTLEPEDIMMVEVAWMQPYLAYTLNKTLPKDVVEARRIV
jgi:hypothetical protein